MTATTPGTGTGWADGSMVWSGWGDPAHRPGLNPAVRRFLRAELGADLEPTPAVAADAVRVRASLIADADRTALARVVGDAHVRTDERARLLHAGGKRYVDLVRMRAGDASTAPDAVVWPGSHDEVAAVLATCGERRVAVVPFGGGTSVVGGVSGERGPFPAVVSLDLSRLDRLLDVDRTSLLATFGAGVRGREADRLLAAHDLVLGHHPQSYEHATIGGFAATRSAGQASTGYGRIDDLVVGVRAATPVGDVRLAPHPGSAAGPDLRRLLVGSEGALGVLTELTLRVRPRPRARRYEAWAVRSWQHGFELLRRLAQDGAAPDVARLSDRDETRTALAQVAGVKGILARGYPRLRLRDVDGFCLLLCGWEGAPAVVRQRRAATVATLREGDAVALGQGAGRAWLHGRYDGPYLRDDLLDHGVLVETLETATTWTQLPRLYDAVRGALRRALAARGTPPLVLCHISHLYATGASLYFTVLARAEPRTAIEQWTAAKAAASEAILGAGATITHHHAVGTDHLPQLPAEIGDVGVTALRALKAALDPQGIMNPGKLIP